MKNSFYILLVFVALAAQAARAGGDSPAKGAGAVIGRLLDYDTREPVAGAVVKAVRADGGTAEFASSDSDGRFQLVPSASTDSLIIRCMGYRTTRVRLPLKQSDLLLRPEETLLNEVVVKAPDIFQRGDTLVFNVGAYATSADDAIIDVIRRLPGVKVEDDGTIMYQGKPINKFYIDGNDFVGDAYSLAANNISKDDVASVEVLENHQPVKALEDIEFSDQGAINLKLKEDARSHWVGVVTAGGGVSPALYTGSTFAMRLAKRMQNMFTVKADNTGWNPANEIRDRGYDPMFSTDYRQSLWHDYISADRIGSPLPESRTRDNTSVLADAITSWGTNDVSKRLKIDYMYDRLDYSTAENTHYFSDNIADFTRRRSMRNSRHSLSAELKSEINRRSGFLKDNLRLDASFDGSDSEITGSGELSQEVGRRSLAVTNDLRLIRKNNERIFQLSSRNSFTHAPAHLYVDEPSGKRTQHIGTNDLRSTTESSYGLFAGFWRLYVIGGLDIDYHHLNLCLTGLGGTYPTAGIYDALLVSAYVSPKAEYERRGWRIELRAPLQWHHYGIRGSHEFLTFRPGLSVRRQVTAKSDLSFGLTYSSLAPSAPMFADCAVMTDYRHITTGFPIDRNTGQTYLSGTYRYRNPMNALFVNLSASYTHSRSPIMENSLFVGDIIFTTYHNTISEADIASLCGGVSKGVAHSRIVTGVDIEYTHTSASAMRDGAVEPFRQSALVLKPYFKGSLTKWMSAVYTLNTCLSSLKVGEMPGSSPVSLNQHLNITLMPSDEVNLTIGAEHYLTRFGDGTSHKADMVLLDASATWELKGGTRLSMTAANILDSGQYRYTTFGTMSRTDHIYSLRRRSLLASIQFRF